MKKSEISIVTLITGQRVITQLQNVVQEENNVPKNICYLFSFPMEIHLGAIQDDGEYEIRFTRWNPFTPEVSFRVPYSYVANVTYPFKSIEELYNEGLKEYYSQVNSDIKED